jgi:hypothetical protein
MTHQELIQKAREHMKLLDGRNAIPPPPSDSYDQARVVDTTLIYFGSQNRDDYIEVVLNTQSGEVISMTYHPQNAGK